MGAPDPERVDRVAALDHAWAEGIPEEGAAEGHGPQPGHGSPSPGGQGAGGKQQQHERCGKTDPNSPNPIAEPVGPPGRESPDQDAEYSQRVAQARCRDEPTDGIPRTLGGQHRSDGCERRDEQHHRDDGCNRPGLVTETDDVASCQPIRQRNGKRSHRQGPDEPRDRDDRSPLHPAVSSWRTTSRPTTLVPVPGADSTCSSPPRAARRSAIP